MSLSWSQLSAIAQTASSGYGSSDSGFILSASAIAGGFFPIPASMDGEELHYYAQNVPTSQREIGKGTYTHSTRTLARADGDISRSTNGNNRVAFTSSPIVVVDWTGYLYEILDTLLNVTGSGTVAGARTALGVAEIDTTGMQVGETIVWNGTKFVRATSHDAGEIT